MISMRAGQMREERDDGRGRIQDMAESGVDIVQVSRGSMFKARRVVLPYKPTREAIAGEVVPAGGLHTTFASDLPHPLGADSVAGAVTAAIAAVVPNWPSAADKGTWMLQDPRDGSWPVCVVAHRGEDEATVWAGVEVDACLTVTTQGDEQVLKRLVRVLVALGALPDPAE